MHSLYICACLQSSFASILSKSSCHCNHSSMRSYLNRFHPDSFKGGTGGMPTIFRWDPSPASGTRTWKTGPHLFSLDRNHRQQCPVGGHSETYSEKVFSEKEDVNTEEGDHCNEEGSGCYWSLQPGAASLCSNCTLFLNRICELKSTVKLNLTSKLKWYCSSGLKLTPHNLWTI